jgi:thiol-disulfide isomerase/thioredoxin
MRKWAAIAWAGWCLAGIGWADEATTAWLAEYPAKLDVLQTVREKGELRIEMAIGGMKSQQIMETEFRYRRPDALVVKGPFTEAYCLGTNATTYQKMMENEYRRETVPGGLAEFLESLQLDMLLMQSDKQVLLQTDADRRAEALDGFFESDLARRLPDEELDGRKCAVFADQVESMFKSSWAKIWLDAETGLLRRMESIPTPEWAPAEETDAEVDEDDDRAAMADAMRNMKLSYVVVEQQVNEPLADDAFAFAPPEGATEDVPTPDEEAAEQAERENEAVQKASGLERFELSGQAAPDFELPLLAGGAFKLSEQKGKVVVIDFWATWCGPCVRALPEMKKLAEAYAENPDVVVVGFSTDDAENRAKVEKRGREGTSGLCDRHRTGGSQGGVQGARHSVHRGGGPGWHRARPAGRLFAPVGKGPEARRGCAAGERSAGKRDALHGGRTPAARGRRLPQVRQEARHRVPWPPRGATGSPARSGQRGSRDVFTNDAAGLEGSEFAGAERVSAALPPRTFVRLNGAQAVLVDAYGGEILRTVDLPADLCVTNERGRVPELVHLRAPDGDVIAGCQERYTVTKRGTSTNYRNRKTELFGLRLSDGEVWRKTLSETHRSAPCSRCRWRPTRTCSWTANWNGLTFYSATGEAVLEQDLDFRTQAIFAQDGAGKTIAYVLDKKIRLYDFVWPLAAPPARRRRPNAPAAAPAAAPAGRMTPRSGAGGASSRGNRAGNGDAAQTGWPLAGWAKRSSAAWSICRGTSGKAAESGVKCWRSPSTGSPTCRRWMRICACGRFRWRRRRARARRLVSPTLGARG